MIPWLLHKPPFAVQTEALRRSEGRRGFLFLMEQGLGKTGVALNEFAYLHSIGKADLMIVVSPNSPRSNWQDEAKDMGFPYPVDLWPMTDKPKVIVINYEALTLGNLGGKGVTVGKGGRFLLNLVQHNKAYLFFDECHRLKNPSSNVTKFVLAHLVKDAAYVRGGTGTPYGKSVMDLYPQLRMVGALNGVNPYSFRSKYAVLAGFQGKTVVGIKKESQQDLYDLIDEHSFRALKCEWTDIPDKLYKSTRVEMPPALMPYYKSMKQDFLVTLDDINGGTEVGANAVITQMGKLQQISSGFIIDEDRACQDLVPVSDLPKYKAILDTLDANGTGSKTIVFVHHTHSLARLVAAFEKDTGHAPAVIKGGLSPEETREQKALFNRDGPPYVIVAQIQAAKEGHTLLGGPATPCYTEVFFETTYNMIDRSQCEDRPHRHGQKHNVLICDFPSSPIEVTAISAIQRKKDVATEILDARRNKTVVL